MSSAFSTLIKLNLFSGAPPLPPLAYKVSPVIGSIGSFAKKTPKGFSGFFEATPSIYKCRQ